MKKQVALVILDGFGHSELDDNNAVSQAKTPFIDSLFEKYPHSLLYAGEEHVGLPKGQFGNSEIGHTTIGAGKIIKTDLVRIFDAITHGEFRQNEVLQNTFQKTKESESTLHIMGLIGEGGVHAHQRHFLEMINFASESGVKQIALHLFTDGRDSGPYDSLMSVKEIVGIADQSDGRVYVSTVSGRYFSMDRDNNWDRLDKFMKLLEKSETNETKNPVEEIERQHKLGKTDEHIEPFLVKPSVIGQKDAVVVMNFRADRARMLTGKLLEQKEEKDLVIATLTEYDKKFNVEVIFKPDVIETTLANEISKAGLTQAHIAETEKFPHATYFLNGGKEEPHSGEEHILLESRKDVATHDEAPEMRAEAITDEAIKRVEAGVDFIFINYANPDMVGHTANVPAIITAVETVDTQLKRFVEALEKAGGVAVITADHGNAELNTDPKSGEKHTAHTLNRVPCIITDEAVAVADGSLQDLAPTVLGLMNLDKPGSMTGNSLI